MAAARDSMRPKLPSLDVFDLLPDAVCVVDPEGRFLFVNARFEPVFGYTAAEVLGRRTFDLIHPDDRAATMASIQRIMAGEVQRHFRNRYLHKDGHFLDIQWAARWLPDHGVRIGIAREVTELRRAEQALEHLATHDLLTGLPNRHRLHRDLQSAIDHAAQTGEHLAVLYVDLDGFKAANDRAGHHAGDRVLREVAHRLQQGLRHGDLAARVGGDEFVVLLPGCGDLAAARVLADGLRARLLPPYTLPDGPIRLDASVGIACYPSDGSDLEGLLAHADRAMYAVKRHGAQRRDTAAE